MIRLLPAVVLAALIGAVGLSPRAVASDTLTVNSDGYTKSGAFYFMEGSNIPYVRKDNWILVPAVWISTSCCSGYWQAAYWRFTGYTYTAVSIDPNRSDARQQLLAMARDAKAADNARLARAQEAKDTLELAQALGLSGVLTPSYIGYPQLSTGSLQLSSAGTQGQTILGYQTYQQTVQSYGANPIDTNALLQQTLRLTEQVHSNSAQANAQTIDLTKVVTADQARLAEAQIRAAAAIAALQASKPEPSTRTTTTIETPVPLPSGNGTTPRVPANVLGPAVAFLSLPGPARCVKCHAGVNGKLEGKFDVRLVPTMIDRTKIVERLLLPEGNAKAMPPDGPRLTTGEIMQFLKPGLEASGQSGGR